MSKILICLLSVICSISVNAQLKIDTGGDGQAHPSAMLDMSSGNKLGVLLPRIPINSPTDRTAIKTPADYLLVFSTSNAYPGLSYWHNGKWNRLLNQSEVYDSISTYHIAQVVLFANMNKAESKAHTTGSKPYILPLNSRPFDSQNAFNTTKHEYVIPENGIYEVLCRAKLYVNLKGGKSGDKITSQAFVVVNDISVVNDIAVSEVKNTVNISAIYIAELKKGDRISGAVGTGNWGNDSLRVDIGTLSVLKY